MRIEKRSDGDHTVLRLRDHGGQQQCADPTNDQGSEQDLVMASAGDIPTKEDSRRY